jgi:hypothetical protein
MPQESWARIKEQRELYKEKCNAPCNEVPMMLAASLKERE